MGSGTTGIAAQLEGFGFIGIERESEYVEIARARIEHHTRQAAECDLPEMDTAWPDGFEMVHTPQRRMPVQAGLF
jgi:site-specific DNA-methyltransferase (adenine-specific)